MITASPESGNISQISTCDNHPEAHGGMIGAFDGDPFSAWLEAAPIQLTADEKAAIRFIVEKQPN